MSESMQVLTQQEANELLFIGAESYYLWDNVENATEDIAELRGYITKETELVFDLEYYGYKLQMNGTLYKFNCSGRCCITRPLKFEREKAMLKKLIGRFGNECTLEKAYNQLEKENKNV